MMWEETPRCPIPNMFKNQIPLYEVIREFKLNLKNETLSVQRWFANCREGLNINYEGLKLSEQVIIQDCEITRVDTCFIPKPRTRDLKNMGENELFDLVVSTLNPEKPEVPTYHNIKRLESYLKELPWQDDLSAIYEGEGTYA